MYDVAHPGEIDRGEEVFGPVVGFAEDTLDLSHTPRDPGEERKNLDNIAD